MNRIYSYIPCSVFRGVSPTCKPTGFCVIGFDVFVLGVSLAFHVHIRCCFFCLRNLFRHDMSSPPNAQEDEQKWKKHKSEFSSESAVPAGLGGTAVDTRDAKDSSQTLTSVDKKAVLNHGAIQQLLTTPELKLSTDKQERYSKALIDNEYLTVEDMKIITVEAMERYGIAGKDAQKIHDLLHPAAVSGVKALKVFDESHVLSQTKDDTWRDVGRQMQFVGRVDFANGVSAAIDALNKKAPLDTKSTTALVYSSVSGTGKTVSFLALKDDKQKVTVAYLGFNTELTLCGDEKLHIIARGEEGAAEVLARRLAAATIISLKNPEAVTALPTYDNVYKGYTIPTVDESKALLLKVTGATKALPLVIVAGVDEVQLLNKSMWIGGNRDDALGLGRFFLRQLRIWQHQWYNDGLRIVPVGTGIAVDWTTHPAFGVNVPLCGGDSVLISKKDFKAVVKSVVDAVGAEELAKRYTSNASKETIIGLLTAMYWPRVRLLEWWREGNLRFLHAPLSDPNSSAWSIWLQYWMQDKEWSRSATKNGLRV